jgi:ABC-type oligopeptide transport system substrate-binding subunit
VAQWRRALPGVQFNVRSVAPTTLNQAARSSQVTLTARRADLPDTLGMMLSRLRTGGAENLGGVSSPDGDTLLDQAATISSSNGIARAEQLYVTNVAWIPLVQGTFAQIMRPEVHGLTFSSDEHISLATSQVGYVVRAN